MAAASPNSTWSGRDALPEEQQATLRKAIRLQWISIAVLAVVITMIGLVMGQSQAMQVAWVEDLLALLPPIAFLIATRLIRKPPRGSTRTGTTARSAWRTSCPPSPCSSWAPTCSWTRPSASSWSTSPPSG